MIFDYKMDGVDKKNIFCFQKEHGKKKSSMGDALRLIEHEARPVGL